MIRLHHGPGSHREVAAEARRDERAVRLDPPGRPRRGWPGVRYWLGGLATRLGDDEIRRGLAAAPAASGPLFGFPDGVPDRNIAPDLRVRPDSHLSHNRILHQLLFDAWADLLAPWTLDARPTFYVSDLGRLDPPSARVLLSFYRRHPDTAPGLVIGVRPSAAYGQAPDERGLLWGPTPQTVEQALLRWRQIGATEMPAAGPGARSDDGDEDPEPTPDTEPFGVCPEDRVATRLETAPVGDGTGDRVAEAVEHLFRRFAFSSALHLGLDFLDSDPDLSPRAAATLHGLVALCAHNRQFHSEGNQPLARFLEHHFRQALKTETRPGLRCALLYRLAVTLGRRQGRIDEAREVADRAVEAARGSDLPEVESLYQESWGRNIRAYLHLRAGDPERGSRDLRMAFSDLSRFEPPSSLGPVPARDLALTHILAAGNLSALANFGGRPDDAYGWRRQGHDLGAGIPALEPFEAGQWYVLCRDFHLPREGLGHVLKGIRGARRDGDPLWLHRLLLARADLLDRLGHATRAWIAYERAHRERQRLGDSRLLETREVRMAETAARAGRPDAARRALVAHHQRTGARAEVQARMARMAARLRRDDTALASLADARRHLDTVPPVRRGRILSILGRACQWLDRPEEAAAAYRRALAEPEAGPHRFFAHLGLWELRETPEASRVGAFTELADALKEPSGWWALPRLRDRLDRHPEGETPAEGVALLGKALSQRHDCAFKSPNEKPPGAGAPGG